jgi:hypothetical protein
MEQTVERHTQRLQVVCGGMLASLAMYGAVVLALPVPVRPALPQGETLLWGFAFLAAVNLATIMPVYRVMLAAPRRVYTVGQQPERLLAAHFAAHVVAFARIEAVAILGLVLFFLSGHGDWFLIFTGVAAGGMLVLWPRRAKMAALLEVPEQAQPLTTSPQ